MNTAFIFIAVIVLVYVAPCMHGYDTIKFVGVMIIMQMKKISLSIGFNDRVTGAQEIPSAQCFDIVAEIISAMTDGATILPSTGVFRHADGRKVTENGCRVECFDPDETALRRAALEIKAQLNQEAIYWSEEMIESEMI